MVTSPFGTSGYSVAYGLAIYGVTPYITTWPSQLTANLIWWTADDATAGEAGAVFVPGALTVGEISSESPAVQVVVAHPSSALGAAVASGSIIGTQAHLIMWAWDDAGVLQYTRDWHMIVARAAHKGLTTTLELHGYRPWASGIGIYGMPILERCPWRYGGPQCGIPAGAGGCPKTTEFCKAQQVNLLTDNAASIETDASAWQALGSGVTVSRTTATAWHGSAALSVACDGTDVGQGCENAVAGRATVSAGGQYCASCYLRAASGTPTISLRVRWYDAAGTLISTSTEYTDLTLTTSWQRVSVVATAPSGAAKAAISPRTTAAVAATWYLDGAMIEAYYPTIRPYPGQFVLPSMGNIVRYGGLITAPKAGMVIRYYISRPAPVQVVDRTPPPNLPPPPQPGQPRLPEDMRRVLRPTKPIPHFQSTEPKPVRRKLGR